MKRIVVSGAMLITILASVARAETPLTITPLAEKKVAALPEGELFWRVEKFKTNAEAKAAVGRWSLAAESAREFWLFTLGPAGGSTAGGTKVAEVGPIPRPAAAEFLLRINQATGAPGAITPVHSHPGSEAFYVLTGEQHVRNAHKTMRVNAGQTEAGCGADIPMQVSSSGAANLHALVMFVVDANRPFSPAATFPE